jgi:hypothetical protein
VRLAIFLSLTARDASTKPNVQLSGRVNREIVDWLAEGLLLSRSSIWQVTMCRDCCALPRAEVGRAEDEFACECESLTANGWPSNIGFRAADQRDGILYVCWDDRCGGNAQAIGWV